MYLKNFLISSAALIALVGCDKDSFTQKQKLEIEEIAKTVVNNILENEPEKFMSSIDKAVHKQQQQAAQRVENNATELQQKLWASKIVIGNKDAKLKLAVFFDPLEPISQKFKEDVMDKVAAERSDVGFFLIPVSIYGGSQDGGEPSGPSSIMASKAIITAIWQSPAKAIALWSKMPNINKEMPKTVLLKFAEEVGLDVQRLERDINSDAAQDALVENGKLAVEVGIPLQLPVIFVRNTDGKLNLIPPFVKEKMILVLDAIRDGNSWTQALSNSMQPKPDAEKKVEENQSAANEETKNESKEEVKVEDTVSEKVEEKKEEVKEEEKKSE